MPLNTSDEAIIEARRAKAWDLRVMGKSYRAIAEETGVSVGTSFHDINTVLERLKTETDETADHHRAVQLSRLDKAIAVIMPMLDDPDMALDAIDRLDKMEKRKSALLGLDAASKQELSGPEGAPIEINARDVLVQRLAGLIAGETAGAAAQGDSGSTEPRGS